MKKIMSKASSAATSTNANGTSFGGGGASGRSSFSVASPPLFKENVSPNVNVSMMGSSVPEVMHPSLKANVRKQLQNGGIYEKSPNLFVLNHATIQEQKLERELEERNKSRQKLLGITHVGTTNSNPMIQSVYERLRRKCINEELLGNVKAMENRAKKWRIYEEPLFSPNIMNPLFYLAHDAGGVNTQTDIAGQSKTGDLVSGYMWYSKKRSILSNAASNNSEINWLKT